MYSRKEALLFFLAYEIQNNIDRNVEGASSLALASRRPKISSWSVQWRCYRPTPFMSPSDACDVWSCEDVYGDSGFGLDPK